MALVFNDNNFKKEIDTTGVVLVDFWAPWCGPCQMLGPIIDDLAKEYEGRVKIGKFNVDENNDIPQELGIRSIPAIKIYKGGVLVEEINGFVPAKTIKEFLDKHLATNSNTN